MASSTGGRRRQAGRAPLTRERVLDAALALIDRSGPTALSMRKLGAELGVEAMSLYNHVTSKADVLDGVVGVLWREVEAHAGTVDGDWRRQAYALAGAIRRVAHAHPQAYPLVLTRGVLPDELLRVGGRLLGALRRAGFADLATPAMLTLASYATAQALAEVTWPANRAAEAPGDTGRPPVVGVDDQLPQHDRASPFALGLDLLIEALERRLSERASPSD